MYIPEPFRQDDLAAALQIIARYPFATVVSHVVPPEISHVPMIAAEGAGDTLLGHVARANPLAAQVLEGVRVTATFLGPHAYVSPTWYVTPSLVPTWNFVAVHVTGRTEPITERAQLAVLVEDLAEHFERSRDDPWIPDYSEGMLDAIVGFRLGIERVEAKFKLSQNRSAVDRAAVVRALEEGGTESRAVAAMMQANETGPS